MASASIVLRILYLKRERKTCTTMPRLLRQVAFYVGTLGVVLVPMVGCALSLKLSLAECTVVPEDNRISMSSIVRFTDFSTAFSVSGTLATLSLLDGLLDNDTTYWGRVQCSIAAVLLLTPFVVPISDAQSYSAGDTNKPGDWAHICGAGGGTLLLWAYVYQMMSAEPNVATTALFATYTLSGAVIITAVLMDSLGALNEARYLVMYGVLWGEFGIAGSIFSLFNYVTKDRPRRALKIASV